MKRVPLAGDLPLDDGGDDNRRMGPPFIGDWSAGFLALNRNKRSLVLDLRDKRGQADANPV